MVALTIMIMRVSSAIQTISGMRMHFTLRGGGTKGSMEKNAFLARR